MIEGEEAGGTERRGYMGERSVREVVGWTLCHGLEMRGGGR